VFALEAALRELLRPDKINLASLGNMTPHLHWHVIPRFRDDPHFPNPIWGARQRESCAPPVDIAALRHALAERLSRL
jgi:diadenosine tetraphosphate (Ap4A) HIT family hydrolase